MTQIPGFSSTHHTATLAMPNLGVAQCSRNSSDAFLDRSASSSQDNMVNYRQHMQRIQEKIGQTHSADGIEEDSWFNIVIAELNTISRECASELQNEHFAPQYMKPYGVEQYQRMPPMRILALCISLLPWFKLKKQNL